MDKEQLKEMLNEALGKLKGDTVSPENAAKFEEHLDAIAEIVAELKIAFGDGLDLSDFEAVGTAVGPIMKLAADFSDYEGSQKKEFVKEVIWTIYHTIDIGEDGDDNKIDLPWLVGGIETRVEKWVIKFAAGLAVDALFKRLREADEV